VITGLQAATCPAGRRGGSLGPSGGAAPQLQVQFSYSGEIKLVVETRVELQRAASFESFRRRLQGLAASAAKGGAAARQQPPPTRQQHQQQSGGKRQQGAAAVGPLHAGLGLGGATLPGGGEMGPAGRRGAGGLMTAEDAEDATDSAMHKAVATTLRDEQWQHLHGSGGAGSDGGGGSPGSPSRGAMRPAGRLLGMLPLRQGREAAATAAVKAAEAFAGGLAQITVELSVSLTRLDGGLLVWLPPPPSDRLWASFLSPPRAELAVRPALAGRALRHAPLAQRVSSWLEGRLMRTLQSGLRFPAAFDLPLPYFSSALDLAATAHDLAADPSHPGRSAGGVRDLDLPEWEEASNNGGEGLLTPSTSTASSGGGEAGAAAGGVDEGVAGIYDAMGRLWEDGGEAAPLSPHGIRPKHEPKQSMIGQAAPPVPAARRDASPTGGGWGVVRAAIGGRSGGGGGPWSSPPPHGFGGGGRGSGYEAAAVANQELLSAPSSAQTSPTHSRQKLPQLQPQQQLLQPQPQQQRGALDSAAGFGSYQGGGGSPNSSSGGGGGFGPSIPGPDGWGGGAGSMAGGAASGPSSGGGSSVKGEQKSGLLAGKFLWSLRRKKKPGAGERLLRELDSVRSRSLDEVTWRKSLTAASARRLQAGGEAAGPPAAGGGAAAAAGQFSVGDECYGDSSEGGAADWDGEAYAGFSGRLTGLAGVSRIGAETVRLVPEGSIVSSPDLGQPRGGCE
jgi:hypothetical protein